MRDRGARPKSNERHPRETRTRCALRLGEIELPQVHLGHLVPRSVLTILVPQLQLPIERSGPRRLLDPNTSPIVAGRMADIDDVDTQGGPVRIVCLDKEAR